MKNILSLFALCLIMASSINPSYAEDRKPGFRIEITVDGLEADRIFIAYHLGNKQYIQDTVEVKNGLAIYEGDERLDGGIYLIVLPPDNNYFEVIIAEDQHFSIKTDVADLVANMRIKGCTENELFYENLQTISEIGLETSALETSLKEMEPGSEAYKTAQTKVKANYAKMGETRENLATEHPELFYAKVIRAMREPKVPEAPEGAGEDFAYYYYRDHYLKEIDWADKRLIRTPVMYNKIITYMTRVMSQHYDSLAQAAVGMITKAEANDTMYQYVAVTLLNYYANSKVMCHDAVYVAIVDKVYKNGNAWWAEEEQKKKIIDRANSLRWTMCGNIPPEMRMEDGAGTIHSMRAIEAEYTILYFWDYDCGHCKKVTPKMAKLLPKYKDKKVAFYGVSINGDIGKWQERLKEYGLDTIPGNIINVQDHDRSTHFDYYYDIRSTPRIILLDSEKRIRAKQISPEQLEEILDMQLKMEDSEKIFEGKGEDEEEEDGE
jgi:thiol-disulfide isomerase/thioredoxin/exonuclease VII small subunit